MFAVIKTGGKQYIAEPGKKLKIEKISADESGRVVFDEVLLAAEGQDVAVGAPTVPGARVEADVTGEGRDRKVIVFKYRAKARWHKKRGHRQHYTEVEIKKISLGK